MSEPGQILGNSQAASMAFKSQSGEEGRVTDRASWDEIAELGRQVIGHCPWKFGSGRTIGRGGSIFAGMTWSLKAEVVGFIGGAETVSNSTLVERDREDRN